MNGKLLYISTLLTSKKHSTQYTEIRKHLEDLKNSSKNHYNIEATLRQSHLCCDRYSWKIGLVRNKDWSLCCTICIKTHQADCQHFSTSIWLKKNWKKPITKQYEYCSWNRHECCSWNRHLHNYVFIWIKNYRNVLILKYSYLHCSAKHKCIIRNTWHLPEKIAVMATKSRIQNKYYANKNELSKTGLGICLV